MLVRGFSFFASQSIARFVTLNPERTQGAKKTAQTRSPRAMGMMMSITGVRRAQSTSTPNWALRAAHLQLQDRGAGAQGAGRCAGPASRHGGAASFLRRPPAAEDALQLKVEIDRSRPRAGPAIRDANATLAITWARLPTTRDGAHPAPFAGRCLYRMTPQDVLNPKGARGGRWCPRRL